MKIREISRNYAKISWNFAKFHPNFMDIEDSVPKISDSPIFFFIFGAFFHNFSRLRHHFFPFSAPSAWFLFIFFFLHFWRLRRQFALFRTPICSFSILAPWVLDLSIIVSSAHRNTYTTVPQHHHYLTPSYSRFPWSPQYLSHGPLPNLLTDHQLPTWPLSIF